MLKVRLEITTVRQVEMVPEGNFFNDKTNHSMKLSKREISDLT
jgi:hypothetical protein